MTCWKCGAETPLGKFCIHCGAKVEWSGDARWRMMHARKAFVSAREKSSVSDSRLYAGILFEAANNRVLGERSSDGEEYWKMSLEHLPEVEALAGRLFDVWEEGAAREGGELHGL